MSVTTRVIILLSRTRTRACNDKSVFDAEASRTPEDKERARRQQLRRLKMKFGLTVNQHHIVTNYLLTSRCLCPYSFTNLLTVPDFCSQRHAGRGSLSEAFQWSHRNVTVEKHLISDRQPLPARR